jgi:hypothetical protein
MCTVSVTLTTRDGQPWAEWLAASCGRDAGPDGGALVMTAGNSSAWDGGWWWDGTGHLRPCDRAWQCWPHRVSPDEHASLPELLQSPTGQGPRSNVSGLPLKSRCWLAPLHLVPKGQCWQHKVSPLVHLQKPVVVQAPTRQLLSWRAVDRCDTTAVDTFAACAAPECAGALGTGASASELLWGACEVERKWLGCRSPVQP